MIRWLTYKELSLELRVGYVAIQKMVATGQIVRIGNPDSYRYLDPGPALFDKLHKNHLDHFAFITAHELAEILGVTYSAVKLNVFRGHIKPSAGGGPGRSPYLFSRNDVRRILAAREKRAGQMKNRYSEILVRWLQKWLKEQKADAQILDELLQQAVKCEEPRKTELIKALWDAFDQVNELLHQAAKG